MLKPSVSPLRPVFGNSRPPQQPPLSRSKTAEPGLSPVPVPQQRVFQHLEQTTMAKLAEAQNAANVARRVKLSVQALQELNRQLKLQANTPARQETLLVLQQLQQFGEAIGTHQFKMSGVDAKPHQMDSFETAAVLEMILDLVHSDQALALNARSHLAALGLKDSQLDKLTQKLQESALPSAGPVKFGSQSLEGLIREAMRTIQENNTMGEVMERVADHYLHETRTMVPPLLFGFMFDVGGFGTGASNIYIPNGADVTIGEPQLYINPHTAAYDPAFNREVDSTWAGLNAQIQQRQAQSAHFAYMKMLQKQKLV